MLLSFYFISFHPLSVSLYETAFTKLAVAPVVERTLDDVPHASEASQYSALFYDNKL
jgi:hypothetical protein